MTSELDLIKTTVEKLRADLMATNMALQCVMTAMPPEAQKQALKGLAQLSVAQEQFVGKSADPDRQAAMQQVAQAVERQYQGLQGAYKSRMSKLQRPS